MIDERIRKYIFAKRIVKSEGVDNVEALTVEKDLQIDLLDNNEVVLNEKSYVILDFGKEIHGTIYFLTHNVESDNNKVRIRLGESVSETCSEIHGKNNATNDHSLRDIETQLLNYSGMEFMQSGFRFARIDNIGEGKIFIRSILAISIMRDLTPLGTFSCDDEEVNKIFDTAAYTLMLNMQTYIWDGIKRDRLVWIGDMHPETQGIACLFGKNELVKKSLNFARKQYPIDKFMNKMPTYSLWYVVIIHDYCFETGDDELLQNNVEYIEGVAQLFNTLIDDDGKFNFWAYLDWPTNETPESEAGVNGLCYLSMKCAKEILSKFGKDTKPCDEIMAKVSKKQNTVTWAKQSAGFLVYSGLKKPEEMHDFLVDGGAKNMSTFLSNYILTAIAMSGDYTSALNIMKEYYGGMLKMGATSFWEDFDIEWMKNASPIDEIVPEGKSDIHGDNGRFCYVGLRHSLCHGWSCGPVQYLMHNVAGFKALEKGAKKLLIKPHLDGLNFIDATFPTIHGVVKIHAENRNNRVYVKTDAPNEVELVYENCIVE